MDNQYDDMLLDGKNCLYRAIYAGKSDKQFPENPCVIFFRFISSYLYRFKPKSVHVFWDSDRQNTWRKLICPEYKEDRKQKCEIGEILSASQEALKAIMPKIGCKIYEIPDQEADDLIYAFCKVQNRNKILIISGDSDFRQITYEYPNIDVFNPLNKEKIVYPREERNLVEIKCFMGETGDNIDGYEKIGVVHATELSLDLKKRFEFFKTHGKALYLRNRKLIDLSLCPDLLTNTEYIKDKLAEETSFDLREVLKVIQTHKIKGLSTEVHKTILPFKFLNKNVSSQI